MSLQTRNQGFTLIELLVVVAIIGILSAIGVVSYGKFKTSAEKKQAEISLNSIYLAQQEYKSNNNEYCINDCNSQKKIVENLFDDMDDLAEQAYYFKITNANTLSIIATNKKNSSCTITITEKNKKPNINGC